MAKQVYTRDQVVAAFRALVGPGMGDPGELDAADPAVRAAETMLTAWYEGLPVGTPAERNEREFSRTTIHYDAGFHGTDYLDEVANDWLCQDAEDAESDGLPELAARIEAKIAEINAKLAQNKA